jgi:hypothetical protein
MGRLDYTGDLLERAVCHLFATMFHSIAINTAEPRPIR